MGMAGNVNAPFPLSWSFPSAATLSGEHGRLEIICDGIGGMIRARCHRVRLPQALLRVLG